MICEKGNIEPKPVDCYVWSKMNLNYSVNYYVEFFEDS